LPPPRTVINSLDGLPLPPRQSHSDSLDGIAPPPISQLPPPRKVINSLDGITPPPLPPSAPQAPLTKEPAVKSPFVAEKVDEDEDDNPPPPPPKKDGVTSTALPTVNDAKAPIDKDVATLKADKDKLDAMKKEVEKKEASLKADKEKLDRDKRDLERITQLATLNKEKEAQIAAEKLKAMENDLLQEKSRIEDIKKNEQKALDARLKADAENEEARAAALQEIDDAVRRTNEASRLSMEAVNAAMAAAEAVKVAEINLQNSLAELNRLRVKHFGESASPTRGSLKMESSITANKTLISAGSFKVASGSFGSSPVTEKRSMSNGMSVEIPTHRPVDFSNGLEMLPAPPPKLTPQSSSRESIDLSNGLTPLPTPPPSRSPAQKMSLNKSAPPPIPASPGVGLPPPPPPPPTR
jgi:hypothetical protein